MENVVLTRVWQFGNYYGEFILIPFALESRLKAEVTKRHTDVFLIGCTEAMDITSAGF